jgi:hypothetical protein
LASGHSSPVSTWNSFATSGLTIMAMVGP